ncbi:hypothetical protein KP509_06G018000 [Ceratopteris richardii]|uniref:Ubiquinol oxidase n=1 Tax=Ceratopteris richardii TaxID=49495 RepID=A0A8T2UQD7_CERRI|nr:hypothetical protein KP509_06G018000 [Ceratopteris richardii]KAH7434440.1 hypothetical protein KP509_06G018000 [Ceratopteris richardii]
MQMQSAVKGAARRLLREAPRRPQALTGVRSSSGRGIHVLPLHPVAPLPHRGAHPGGLSNMKSLLICNFTPFRSTSMGAMGFSSSAAAASEKNVESSNSTSSSGPLAKGVSDDLKESNDTKISHYWGIAPKAVFREDGSEWPWRSFMPWETYSANVSINLHRHHATTTLIDKIAFRTVKYLRVPVDLFFQKRYGCRAMMLETVAAVPGMVGGMFLHLRSLRKFEHSGGWIKALLEEAENERMHLMTFMEVAQPKWYERALVVTVQGIFLNAYVLLYLTSPRLAHRIVGYLEEEAIHSYTQYLHEIDCGRIPNVPAPAIAMDYWRLPRDATIREVVEVVRADEAHHRDVNHFAADIHEEGKRLKDSAAPLGYH